MKDKLKRIKQYIGDFLDENLILKYFLIIFGIITILVCWCCILNYLNQAVPGVNKLN